MNEVVKVARKNGQILLIAGITIGIYTVAPALCENSNGKGIFTAGAWSTRIAASGMTIGCFYSRAVAQNFARHLWAQYGDISEVWQRCFDYCETPEDTTLLNFIDKRADHISRVKKGMKVPDIAIPQGGFS